MVFPRINRLSYQLFLLSALVLIASLFVPGGGFGGAWTAYPPLSANGELQPDAGRLARMWVLAVALEFVAFLLGGINFIVTSMNSRAPGMKAFDVPIVVWMIVVASLLFMASVGPLIAGAVMLLFDQLLGHRASTTRPAAATRSCGSTCSGSSATPRCTSCCCRRWASWPRS